jgi:genome maintenance exonuclease 1
MILTRPYEYKQLTQITHESGSRVYDVGEPVPLPSVTTILQATKSEESKKALDDWRKAVGDEEADKVVTLSTSLGNAMHDNLENYVLSEGESKHTGALLAKMMTKLIINKGLKNVDEVWGTEAQLYYPELYAGTTDLCGVWKGKPAIMDYKNSRKEKKEEWVDDYKMQLCAYALAHNKVYGTNIDTGVIFMATHNMVYQEFVLEGEEFQKYTNMWLAKVKEFYEMKPQTA